MAAHQDANGTILYPTCVRAQVISAGGDRTLGPGRLAIRAHGPLAMPGFCAVGQAARIGRRGRVSAWPREITHAIPLRADGCVSTRQRIAATWRSVCAPVSGPTVASGLGVVSAGARKCLKGQAEEAGDRRRKPFRCAFKDISSMRLRHIRPCLLTRTDVCCFQKYAILARISSLARAGQGLVSQTGSPSKRNIRPLQAPTRHGSSV